MINVTSNHQLSINHEFPEPEPDTALLKADKSNDLTNVHN